MVFRHFEAFILGNDDSPQLPPKKFASEMKQGLVLDARNPEAFAGGHIPESLSIWLKGLAVFGGWVATETTAVYLVLDDASDAESAILSLARLGIDRVEAVLTGGFDAWRDAATSARLLGTSESPLGQSRCPPLAEPPG